MSKKNIFKGSENKPKPKTPREEFDEHYKLTTDRDIMLDVLYEFKKANHLNEKTRDNVRGLYNWLVVIPLVVIALYLISQFFNSAL